MKRGCNFFLNRPLNSYRPLACKPLLVHSRELGGHGAANRQELFFVTKAATIREHATLDLIYRTPEWIRNATEGSPFMTFNRVTSEGELRIIDTGLIRVTA